MMNKAEIVSLSKELQDIKNLKIQIENITKQRNEEQIPKRLIAYNLACSVMFVDMRNSTDMTDNNGRKDMIKIYKMFAKLVIKAVENNNGRVEQIMGDGLLCTFINDNIPSGDHAINAAMDINTYLDQAYNAIVEKDWEIKCGIGIRTGHIYVTRIGIRGKNKVSKVAYPSAITNYACKMCGAAEGGEILFDETTYSQIQNKNLKEEAKTVAKDRIGKCKSIKGRIWRIEA